MPGPGAAAAADELSRQSRAAPLDSRAEGGPGDAAKPLKVCFHVRGLEYLDSSSSAAAEDAKEAAAARCTTLCVRSGPRGPPALVGAADPEDMSPPSDYNEIETSVCNTEVSDARQSFYLSSPSGSDIVLKMRETPEFARQKALQDEGVIQAIASAALAGWSAYSRQAVSVSVLSGGLSNQLYLVTLNTEGQQPQAAAPPALRGGTGGPQGGPCEDTRGPLVTKALVRVYGHQQGTTLFNARNERKLFKALGRLDIAPYCLAEFEVSQTPTPL